MAKPDANRREFLARTAQGVAVAVCGGLIWNAFLAQSAKAAPDALRPPGAKGEADFNATCIKCGLCVEACPYATLKLAQVAAKAPLGTPYFEPREVPCYMCPSVPCAKACPTGALDPEIGDIATARMGLAVVDPEHCLSWQGLRCEVCYRVCPVQGKAITVDPHPRQLSNHAIFVPVVHSDACTGCGLCEKACPTELASIRVVQPSLVQGKIGAHYRLGWREDQPPAPSATTSPPPSATPAVPPKAAPGVDYLNRGGGL